MEEPLFISGVLPEPAGPLGRYLPPIPAGVCAAWLVNRAPPGSWVLDPFGASPRTAVEAARAGYRVLVASNNPIDRFLLDLTANPPAEAELRSSLADLGATLKGDQRLEPHLRDLYTTSCNHCQNKISAEAFIWDRGSASPYSRLYHCPRCGESGEFPITPADEAHLSQLPSSQLHRARALERVTPRDDPDRVFVEEALDVYLPRALYALFTLVNKLDSLLPRQRRLICTLLLAAFDQANTLWPHPSQRNRPRQLTIPTHFRENNVWLALEEAIETWRAAYPVQKQHAPVTIWPQTPPESGGICLFEGRLKELADSWTDQRRLDHQTTEITIQAVIAALPRPNQAYWTLSALWAGWLWGREEAASFKVVLRRRRYDWIWHTAALHSAFTSLSKMLLPHTPILGMIGESETGFLSAAVLAAEKAGLIFGGIAFRQANEQAQITWSQPAIENIFLSEDVVNPALQIQTIYQQAGLEYLRLRGEPASYLELHTAGLAGLVRSNFLKTFQPVSVEHQTETEHHEEASPAEFYSQINTTLQSAFSFRAGFVRFHGSQKALEVGQWWLRESATLLITPGEEDRKSSVIVPSAEIAAPLSDRIEMEIVRLLVKSEDISMTLIDQTLVSIFTGLLTPDANFIQACCESYAEPVAGKTNIWRLRSQEMPKNRRADITAISDLLISLGTRLHYFAKRTGEDSRWITWHDPGGNLKYAFYPAASARLGSLFLQNDFPARNCLLVYPGGRAGLIQYKLRRDARLEAFASQGWRFLKFRHVRFLAESELLTQGNLDEQLVLDPMTNQDTQMTFL